MPKNSPPQRLTKKFRLPFKNLTSVWPSQCPRRESNTDLQFRKPSFDPLNYGDSDSRKAVGEITDDERASKSLVICGSGEILLNDED